MTKKKAIISVKTVQDIDGEREVIELVTEGDFYRLGEDFIAEYDETEISGMEGTKTTLKIEKDKVSIIRRGTTNSDLEFKKGETTFSLYSTPFGVLNITIKPILVQINVDENGGNVKLEYQVNTNNSGFIENVLELKITPKN
ncbi:Uncharacterized beta-barrel protein YwiB, DUF1934 family [Caloramator fervidus]|uniref:Uncharacterized beta-barrel protein YwiB, DUF1934 family n=1 Tax=Caloramator fervidus TaxID=29344 RepID=A0A1H5RK95_9CLOT|nr:DUF1934 domain-containing protein [Caloramator fervidus]SEF38759.1 Uncharacterized beta-barrel protein YwiB, DUF1934 family [Caloramator fervidus]